MKDNKTVLIILLFLVIGIWIKVFFKISDNFSSQQLLLDSNDRNNDKIELKVRDTFSLEFNGIDPFLHKRRSVAVKNPESIISVARRNQPTPIRKMSWPKFEYYGFVKGTQKKSKLAILKSNGIIMNLREGEDFYDGFILKSAHRDSVIIKFGSNYKTVLKK